MKRILINAAHNEEVRVALCNGSHLYDFDLENRTREQKKSNIYKGRITRIEQSLEAVFVEYGSQRQGFLPLREIAPEYLLGNPRELPLKQVIKEGDELIVQVEKEERGNKGAALSTYISLAGRYLVLMPNNAKGGGISRQISGKVRDEMRQIIASLTLPKGMSVIVRTAGIGRSYEELHNDLTHLLETWANIQNVCAENPAPILLHQEASVVTRAVRDYLRDDIGEVWIDNEYAYNEAAHFISQVMPTQMSKLRKYTEYEPIFVKFGIERQIETAYQREVRLPSGGSIVIDQTEAMVSIDINSSKSTKGADVAETAFNTNLEAADEIARQLRLRDMGGLIVIDFIDMADPTHQKAVEKRLQEATRYDRARIQFAEISKFGLLEMSRQRLRPSLDETTGYICPRCHGNGMVRDVRSLALSIMRQVEQLALQNQYGEIQVDVPTEIAAFLLNEKRESLVYLEQDTGVRITILPHAHLESPNFDLHFNPDGFAPATYERIVDVEKQQADRGYEVNWQTAQHSQPEKTGANHWQQTQTKPSKSIDKPTKDARPERAEKTTETDKPSAVAWLSNLFAPKPQAHLAHSFSNQDAASAIESIVNTGATSLGASGQIVLPAAESPKVLATKETKEQKDLKKPYYNKEHKDARPQKSDDKKSEKPHYKSEPKTDKPKEKSEKEKSTDKAQKRELGSVREARGEIVREPTLTPKPKAETVNKEKPAPKKVDNDKPEKVEKTETPTQAHDTAEKADKKPATQKIQKSEKDFALHILPVVQATHQTPKLVHLPLDGSKVDDKLDNQDNHLANDCVLATDHSTNDSLTNDHQPDVATQDTEVVSIVIQPPSPSDLVNETVSTQDKPATVLEVNTDKAIESSDEPVVLGEPLKEHKPVEIDNTPTQDDGDVCAEVVDTTTHETTNTAVSEPEAYFSTLEHSVRCQRTTYQAPASINMALAMALASDKQLANNDPRIVLMASIKPSTITGTVGEFIRQHLPNGDEMIANQGMVASFILALDSQKSMSTPTFANYGYPALSDEIWRAFDEQYAINEQYAIGAGKTLAVPPASERAINDPRHLDVHQQTSSKASGETDEVNADTNQPFNLETETDTPILESAAKQSKEPKPEKIDAQTTRALAVIGLLGQIADAPDDNALAHILLGRAAPTLIAEQGLHASLLQGLNKLEVQLDEVAQTLGLTQSPKTNARQESSTNKKSNYRHKIDSIVEQLSEQLPQVGILNLSKPTPVKIKIKKPKNEKSNKPKVEIVKRKTDDNDN